MQISPIKNQNFEKPSGNPSNRTKVKNLEKKILDISQKIWFRVCSVTAEMFIHRNSGENRRKRIEIFFKNLRRAYKDLIQVKKNSKLSHACVPLTYIQGSLCNSVKHSVPELCVPGCKKPLISSRHPGCFDHHCPLLIGVLHQGRFSHPLSGGHLQPAIRHSL